MLMGFVKKLFLLLVLVAGAGWLNVGTVLAASLTRTMVRYDRLKAATATNVYVKFVPATVTSVNTVKVIFGTATVGAGASVTVTNLETGATALPGTLTATSVGTSEVDIGGISALSIGQTYGFNITGGVVTTGSAGASKDIVSTFASSSLVESSTVANSFVANDQIVITANVPPTFTFSVGATADSFTTDLSSTAISATTGVDVTITTNAAKGWTAWVKSANAALSSVTTAESIGTSGVVNGTPDVCGMGTDCYLLKAAVKTNGSGALTISPEYLAVGTTDGGGLSTTFQPVAFATAKTGGDAITLTARATMIATKAAANDYTDTLTVVAAGNF